MMIVTVRDTVIKTSWDIGSSYDFFASLIVLHDPDLFGLRPSWAAGVRSRLPPDDRQILEDLIPTIGVPIDWILSSPALRDASAAISALRQISPLESLRHLSVPLRLEKGFQQRLNMIVSAGRWQNEDLEALKAVYGHHKIPKDRHLKAFLDAWAAPLDTGSRLVSALQAYYQVFYAEEEKHIQPLLYQGLAHAQEQSAQMSLPGLLDTLSQGVHLSIPEDISEVILIPSIWITPLVIIHHLPENRLGFLFGVRPANVSLVPGEVVPDGMLRVLKALADPTRLRMLRYLGEQTSTLAELSRKLRLRPPTVLHHLGLLRLAGLVHIVLQENGERRYSLRREGIPIAFNSLDQFLRSGEN